MIDRAASFLEACGSVGPLVLGVDEPGASGPSWRVVDHPFALIGRSPQADLFFNDAAVSRRHAYLQVVDGRLFCIDLQSRTGTHWGSEAGVWGWIEPGGGVKIGPYTVRSRGCGAGSTALPEPRTTLAVPTSRSFDRPGLAEMILEIAGRTNGPATWRVSRSLTLIGDSSACRIRLDGGKIASIHASLVRTPAGVFVVDLLGPGGVLLNGEQVDYARLAPGDELAVGPHRIRVRQTLTALEADGLNSAPASVSGGANAGIEALARALVEELGRSHGLAADRLHGTLVTVLESIATMQRDQMAAIAAELGQIRRLAEEEQAARLRVEHRADSRPVTLRLVADGLEPGRLLEADPVVSPHRLAQINRSVPLRLPADAPRHRPSSAAAEADFHTRVFDRLAAIQGESHEEGGWRRLLETMLGRGRQDLPRRDHNA